MDSGTIIPIILSVCLMIVRTITGYLDKQNDKKEEERRKTAGVKDFYADIQESAKGDNDMRFNVHIHKLHDYSKHDTDTDSDTV